MAPVGRLMKAESAGPYFPPGIEVTRPEIYHLAWPSSCQKLESNETPDLAGDIGTTTVVLNLVDLESGETVQTSSFENPQRFGGADIMNRISYYRGDFSGELQQVMLSSINFEIGSMTRASRVHRRQIYDVVLVGNTTMRDILFGVDVQSVGQKPYKSTV